MRQHTTVLVKKKTEKIQLPLPDTIPQQTYIWKVRHMESKIIISQPDTGTVVD